MNDERKPQEWRSDYTDAGAANEGFRCEIGHRPAATIESATRIPNGIIACGRRSRRLVNQVSYVVADIVLEKLKVHITHDRSA